MGNAASSSQISEGSHAEREAEIDREVSSGTRLTESELADRGEVEKEANKKSQFGGDNLTSLNSLPPYTSVNPHRLSYMS